MHVRAMFQPSMNDAGMRVTSSIITLKYGLVVVSNSERCRMQPRHLR